MEGEGNELNRTEKWEVDRFNDIVQYYNGNCVSKSYTGTDKQIVESELTPMKQEFLREDGAIRLIAARANREARRMHVKEEIAIIRTSPIDNAGEIERVRRWGDLIATGKTKGPWYEVEWSDPSLDNVLRYGWVLGGLLERGSGKLARFEYCESVAGRRENHNEIIRGGEKIDSRSARSLSVKNGTDTDSYIKIIDKRYPDQAAITFFVERGRTAEISGIPRGSYELVFAGGTLFSRGCDTFSRPKSAKRFSERFDFEPDGVGWTVTLYTMTEGNTKAWEMDYDDFDKL